MITSTSHLICCLNHEFSMRCHEKINTLVKTSSEYERKSRNPIVLDKWRFYIYFNFFNVKNQGAKYFYNPLQPGIQNVLHEKSVCTNLKNVVFSKLFLKKCNAGRKQTRAKIWAHLWGPWSWLHQFATVKKILIEQYPGWNGLRQ